jgi:hypothetical protein
MSSGVASRQSAGGLDPVKFAQLFAIEEIKHRTSYASQSLKITYSFRIDINAANTSEFGAERTDLRAPAVESPCAATHAATQVEMANFDFRYSTSHATVLEKRKGQRLPAPPENCWPRLPSAARTQPHGSHNSE